MKKVASVLLICLISFSGISQSSDLGNWMMYFGNKNLKNGWNWHHEVQYRNYNFIGDLEQLLLRTGIGYNLTENNNNLLLGYGFINGQVYSNAHVDKVEINEHRIYQQFINRHAIGRVNLQHRFRLEERFFEDQDLQLRLRYFLGLTIPINNTSIVEKTFYGSIYNELFLNGEKDYFDRNRLYAGVGYKPNSKIKFELGYMNQFFQSSGRDQINIMMFLNF
ncbi:DUF2490 domain-containing protein [Brumimicrobium aurantiacum]|uniref:DUF2490 domain-containing protein n=2 Tax=Brumimicrobium aurantiacum TaxID=1737063 RepID=A0A3E1EWY3_9FLAO|nr:DUF2490 domain-containing protein [Brumimicrobium aurantiacum]